MHYTLLTRVTEHLRRGHTHADIIEELQKEGWKRSEIESAIAELVHPQGSLSYALSYLLGHPVSYAVLIVGIIVGVSPYLMPQISLAFLEPTYHYNLVAPSDTGGGVALQFGATPGLSKPSYFSAVRESLITQKTSFILADLDAMKITVYEDGASVASVPIKAKGREGSWWETPAGLYKIETKEEQHFSSIGHVYQPYSMAFQGNFFIHGWPHYEDGTPVSTSYSGGCIRLSDEDAQVVYTHAKVGMPVLVYTKALDVDGSVFTSTVPGVTAKRYVVTDLESGFVFAHSKSVPEGPVAPIASLTKLMTALVAAEYINLDADLMVSSDALVETTIKRLKSGEYVSAYQLLFPLLMESSNEAAEVFAAKMGKDWFVSRMNEKAKAIGMRDTHFADASGLSDQNTSTVEDLVNLARYISSNRSFIFKITRGDVKGSAYGDVEFKGLQNFNDFQGVEGFVGGKIGNTDEAKETGLFVFDLKRGDETRRVAIVLLGSNDQKHDAEKLLAFVKQHYF